MVNSASDIERNAITLLVSMAGTFLVLRASLYFSPDSDFNVGSYNIHHLFTGLLLAALGGIPLALFSGGGRLRWAALVIFGVGLAMALDEWVYLIVTDGSNASYLLPISFWGGAVVVGLACAYTIVLTILGRKRRKNNLVATPPR